jgi:glycosyltransferase involved in cell wall biosynthesis
VSEPAPALRPPWLPHSLSVVVPVYDEEENARALVETVVSALRPLGVPFELVVVDDGSRDATLAALRELLPLVPELVVVALSRNFGQTLALQAALDRARGEVVVTMDGDLQNDPRDIPKLLQALHEGASVASGWRKDRQDTLILRKIPSWVANRLIRAVTGVRIHDQGCSLKAYRREVIERLDLYADMHRFIAILTMATGARIAEVEVRHHPRVRGTSKYGLSRTFKVIADLFTIQMLTWFREQPLRFFALLGLPWLVTMVAAGLASLISSQGVVLETVALVAGTTFGACLMLGLLGETLIEEEPDAGPLPVVCREWEASAP